MKPTLTLLSALLLDLYPTLVELCNLPKAPGLDGVSLVPVLASPLESVQRGGATPWTNSNDSKRMGANE